MILAFLWHHLERAKRGEIKNAIRHCHVKGLTSVMLHEEEGNTIRLFSTSRDHEMHWSGLMGDPMPLAIHGHRTEVQLVGLYGAATSWVFEESSSPAACRFDACRFVSEIIDGEGALVRTGRKVGLVEVFERSRSLGWGSDQHLKARELHTVSVQPDREAAWLVIEGKVDPDPSGLCYTNNPSWSPVGLYETATQAEIIDALARAHSRIP